MDVKAALLKKLVTLGWGITQKNDQHGKQMRVANAFKDVELAILVHCALQRKPSNIKTAEAA